MSEQNSVQAVTRPNTVSSLAAELRALGVGEGDTLLVHSAMSALGWVCGGPVAVIESLLRALGEGGTLVMPAHTGDNSDPAQWQNPPVPESWWETIRDNMPAFDPAATPTRCMGRVAETFRKYPGALRSSHPQTSMCALGPRASEITRDHPLTPQMGMDAPVGRLYQMNAKILLLGVGYDNCTCLHLAETLSGAPKTRMGATMTENGRRVWKWYEDVDFDSDCFPQIGAAYESDGGEIRVSQIGAATCRLIPARPLIDYGLLWYAKTP